MKKYDYVIVGAGSSGRTAAETLAEASAGSILLIDSENCLPYKRTQVSKNAAAGFEVEDFAIHDEAWYAESGVTLKTGVTVSDLSLDEKAITVGNDVIGYHHILLALGASPRDPFDAIPPERRSVLWTKMDAMELRNGVAERRRVAVIGNGVLGVEALWQLKQMGKDVSLLGRGAYPLAKYLDSECADSLTKAIDAANVRTRYGVSVTHAEMDDDEIVLDVDGTSMRTDYIVTSIGSVPVIELAQRAGVPCGKGILVNEFLQTGIEGVWAAGDCAEHPDGTVTGLWHPAEHQGRLAALDMLGKGEKNKNPPYRLKCEVFGGLWFSGGKINGGADAEKRDTAETWTVGSILWRPRFEDNRLAALTASAPAGMDKQTAKTAQKLLLDEAGRAHCTAVLLGAEGSRV